MRRSTSPVGPLMAVALLCAMGVNPVRADDVHHNGPATGSAEYGDADSAVVPGELRGSVDPSAWAFLEGPAPSVQVEALPPPVAGVASDAAEKQLSAEERDRLTQALLSDPHSPGTISRTLPARRPASMQSNGIEVSRSRHGDGLSTVTINKPIAPAATDWKARVGADLGMAADAASTGASPDNPLRVQRNASGANAAWASVDVREFATVDARVSPASEQGMLATTFKRSVPIGSNLSMTLQSRTSMTETFGRGTSTSDIPLMALPAADGTTTPRVWGQENSARLNILATGTTFGAGVSSSSTDTVTHNTLTAEQKLYGPVSVSTAITDAGRSWENKSVSARARFHW